MKKVKCEWCGYNYNPYDFDVCPKCGGINSNLANLREKELKEIKDAQNKGTKTILWILFIIFGLPTIVGGLIAILGFLIFFFKVDEFERVEETTEYVSDFEKIEDIPYDEDKLIIEDVYENSYEEVDDTSDYYWDDDIYNYGIYYTNDMVVKLNDSSLVIPEIHMDIDRPIYNDVHFTFDYFIDTPDYESHIIDLYLVSNGQKYRLIDTYYDAQIESFNDIFKIEGIHTCETNISVPENFSPDMFDFLLVVIDNQELSIPLRYFNNVVVCDKLADIDEIKFNVGAKILFGENNENVLYVDSLNIRNYISVYSHLNLELESRISNFNGSDIEIYLEDSNGDFYRVYEENNFFYKEVFNNFEDLTLSNFEEDSVSAIVFKNAKDFVKIHIIIDEKLNSFDLI